MIFSLFSIVVVLSVSRAADKNFFVGIFCGLLVGLYLFVQEVNTRRKSRAAV